MYIMCMDIWCCTGPGWVGVNFSSEQTVWCCIRFFFPMYNVCVCVYKYIYVILK